MIMVRHADDTPEALMMAQCMEDAGADVFSITSTSRIVDTGFRPFDTEIGYSVWAKARDEAHIDAIDEAIDKQLFGR